MLLLLLCLFLPSFAYGEDYAAYARVQANSQEAIVAPYLQEVKRLKEKVLIRQAQPDIQAWKAELREAVSTDFKTETKGITPILIFVSFSMPQESLKGWLQQAKRVGAAVYIRGLVDNSFIKTAKAVTALLKDQKGGLLIDPPLFKKYAITEVPAVVVSNQGDFDVIYGDVTLDYALEKIMQSRKSDFLQKAILKLRSVQND